MRSLQQLHIGFDWRVQELRQVLDGVLFEPGLWQVRKSVVVALVSFALDYRLDFVLCSSAFCDSICFVALRARMSTFIACLSAVVVRQEAAADDSAAGSQVRTRPIVMLLVAVIAG
jgi:hypothetical protein